MDITQSTQELLKGLTSNIYNIGDRVKNLNNIGVPITGTIIGSILATLFLGLSSKQDIEIWSSTYPNWRKKPVYYVLLDNLTRPISFESWCNYNNIPIEENNNSIIQIYNNVINEVRILTFVEDDLEEIYE